MEQLFREILMEAPGALIRWIWYRGKKSYSDLLTDDSVYNVLLSFVVIGVIIGSIILLK